MEYVSVGRRAGAFLVDVLVSIVWTLPLVEITKTTTPMGTSYTLSLTGWRFAAVVVLWIVYTTVTEAALGATLGKLAVGVRVVGDDGGRMSTGRSVVRNVARLIDLIPWIIPYLLGAIFVWNSPTRQRLGDRWARSVVIVRGSNERAATGVGASEPHSAFAGTDRDQRDVVSPPLPAPPPGAPPE